MALIKCPECKSTISSTAETCPHCGYKLTQEEVEKALLDAEYDPPKMEQHKTESKPTAEEDEGSFGGGLVLGLLLGLIGLIIVACVGKKNTKSGAVLGFIIQAILGLTLWGLGAF